MTKKGTETVSYLGATADTMSRFEHGDGALQRALRVSAAARFQGEVRTVEDDLRAAREEARLRTRGRTDT